MSNIDGKIFHLQTNFKIYRDAVGYQLIDIALLAIDFFVRRRQFYHSLIYLQFDYEMRKQVNSESFIS